MATIVSQAQGVASEPTQPNRFGQAFQDPFTQSQRATNIAERERVPATKLESARAAMDTSLTARLWDMYNAPKFQEDPEFNAVDRINEMKFPPTIKELDHLRESKSNAEFDYRLENIETYRKNMEMMGDNPLTSFVVGMADPAYLGLDALTLAGGRVLQLGRLGAAALTGAGTAALEYAGSQHLPLDASDILVASLVNSAAVGALYRRPPELKATDDVLNKAKNQTVRNSTVEVPNSNKVTPEGNLHTTPNKTKVTDTVEGAGTTNNVVRETLERVRETSTAAASVRGTVREILDTELRANFIKPTNVEVNAFRALTDKVGNTLDNIKVVVDDTVNPSYNPTTRTITVGSKSHLGEFTHELTHAATADKLLWGQHNPNTTHGRLYRELGEQVRDIKNRIDKDTWEGLDPQTKYFLGEGVKDPTHIPHEFVAGLMSGNKEFLKLLSKMPEVAPIPQRTMAQKAWDTVRKLLGLNPQEATMLRKALDSLNEVLDTPLPKEVGSLEEFLMREVGVDTTFELAVKSIERQADTWASKLGGKIAWNLAKTMRAIGDGTISDKIVSNPLDPSQVSASSIQRAIKADLDRVVYRYEDQQFQVLANRGIPKWKLLTKEGKEAQDRLDYEVASELVRREHISRYNGTIDIDPNNPIHELANRYEAIMDASLKVEKDSGVLGAGDVFNPIRGYFPRSWNANKLSEIDLAFGGDRDLVAQEFAKSFRNTNLSSSESILMAKAILDRTRRAGDMSDRAFRGHSGGDLVREVEYFLRRNGLGEDGIDRVTALLEGRIDEAGKASRFKNRMDIDMTIELTAPDGTVWRPLDIMDYDLNRLADIRVHESSGSAALAQQGFVSPTEIAKAREQYALSAKSSDRQQAYNLFDNSINAILGKPVGEDMTNAMRIMSAVTQMVGLAYSGLWQVTEYAKIGMRYGLLRTVKEVTKELPLLREVIDKDSTSLVNVLSCNAHQDVRIRPLLRRMEDGHTMSTSQSMLQNLQYMKQTVPFLNGMAYVQRHQARVNANLMLDSIRRAAEGDVKAKNALAKYGIDDNVLNKVSGELKTNGIEISNWSEGAWEAVRAPLTSMVDDNVLRSRLGEIPAYAQFTQLGRFIFTFRSFVLGAHNKILASTLVNDGARAYATMMAYQLPLTAMMTQAQSVIAGRGYIDDPMEWAEASLSQAGGLGLFADAAGVFMGGKDQFGAPGLIAVDRGFRVLSNVPGLFQGDVGGFSKSVIDATPLLSVVPFTKGLHILWR